MVRKKIKSKRTTTKQRVKIEKKVKEHHRKQAKIAKKNLNIPKKNTKKDPGIPSNIPFRDEIIKEAQAEKERLKAEKEQRRNQKSMLIDAMDIQNDQLEQLVQNAQHRLDTYSDHDSPVKTYKLPDNSKRAYFKEFQKVVEMSDVILEVLDARDPLGTRIKYIEQQILENNNTKRIILILNKIDLIPKENAISWLSYLRNEFPTIAFKNVLSFNTSRGKDIQFSNTSDTKSSSSWTIGAESLLQLLKNYCRNANIKTSITVGVIGFPNVGKSSLINSLKRTKACQVGSIPGITTSLQLVSLDSNINLLDSPGIVFSNDDSSLLKNCLRVEQLDDPIVPIQEILSHCPSKPFMLIYNIPQYSNSDEFLLNIAKKYGKIKKHGIPDLESAARIVLNDWNTGKIPFYTNPPSRKEHLYSAIVQSWGKEFDTNIHDDEILHNQQKYSFPLDSRIYHHSNNPIIEKNDQLPNFQSRKELKKMIKSEKRRERKQKDMDVDDDSLLLNALPTSN